MSQYLVHIRRSGIQSGWAATATAHGDTFAEAAIAAVIDHNRQRGLDLDRIAYTAEFVERPNNDTIRFEDDQDTYQTVVFYWAEEHPVFDPLRFRGWGTARPGDYWFSHQVREGQPGDCHVCAGTHVDPYNPFRRCRVCSGGGDRVQVDASRAKEAHAR